MSPLLNGLNGLNVEPLGAKVSVFLRLTETGPWKRIISKLFELA